MGEMSKVEEVARAIACSHGGKITGPSRSRATDEFGWDPDHDFMRKYIEAHWEEHEHAAGFAIEAFRKMEPTDAMMAAMWSLSYSNTRESFAACWEAMIDAALKE